MYKSLKNIVRYSALIIVTILILFWGGVTELAAQEEPTAIITALKGTVLVSIQGREAISAQTGMILRAGDRIETQIGAEAVLTLSDDSELQLGENAKMDIEILAQNVSTKARKSRLKLWWGKVRSVLSSDHQAEGSSFSVETPNALAGVKFSQPVVDVTYNPETDQTTIDAFTVDVVVTNLRTLRKELIPKGRQAVVLRNKISIGSISRRSSSPSQKPSGQKPEQDQPQGMSPPDGPPGSSGQLQPGQPGGGPPTTIFRQTRGAIQQATSPMVPAPGGNGPGTAPPPGERPQRPDQQRRVITIRFRQE